MSRTKKFLYNSGSTILLQLVTLIIGFILPKVILKNYGSEINGLVTSITQFISYFNLVEAGLASAAIYALYKPLADENHKLINGIVSAAKKFYNTSGYIFISLVLGLAIFYPLFGKADFMSTFDLIILVIVLGTNGVLEFFSMAKYRVLLTADQKTYVLSFASIVNIVVNAIITIILANLGVNITIVKIVSLVSILLRASILMIYVRKNYNYINYNSKPELKALDKRWDALYLQVLGAIQVGIPVILATFLTDYTTVSIYSIYYMVIGGINSVLAIFISGLSASFGDIMAREETEKLKKVTQEFEYLYYDLLIFVYLVAFQMISPFIKIYTNDITNVEYSIPILGLLFILNGFFYNLKTPQGTLVISAGLYKETRKQTTIQALIIVFVGGLLGFLMSKISPIIGLCGIMIGSILSNVYRSIDLLIFIPKNVTKLPVSKTLIRWGKLLIITIISLITMRFFDFKANSYFVWVLKSIKACLIVGVYILIFDMIFERKIIKSVLERFKYILRRNKNENL